MSVWNKGKTSHEDSRILTGINHPLWKGDRVGYLALHAWVERHLGKPSYCEKCGTTAKRRYEWANKSREYKRDLTDWERLCVPCHRKDSYLFGEATPWNKGKKTGLVPRTAFKKGQVSPRKGTGRANYVCPICNGEKSKYAKSCMRCRSRL